MFNRTEIAEGVTIFTRKSEQFKTVNFSIKLKRPLNTEEAANRTVLTNVLQHSNAKFQSAAAMRMKLDDLYGMVLYLDTTKQGNEQIVLLNVETVNDHYLKTGDVLNEVLSLMHTVLFEPNLDEQGLFQQTIVEREREMVVERIQSVFDDKSRYAQKRLQEILRPNHPVSTSVNGTVETVQAVTPASLKEAYEAMLNEDEIDIFVIGDIDEQQMIQSLKEVFPLVHVNQKWHLHYQNHMQQRTTQKKHLIHAKGNYISVIQRRCSLQARISRKCKSLTGFLVVTHMRNYL